MKIYGHTISPVNPYKSILLLPTDLVEEVVRQALEKYGLGKENPSDYNLHQVHTDSSVTHFGTVLYLPLEPVEV